MEEPQPIPKKSMKIIQLENEGNIYICKLQVVDNSITANIFLSDSSVFKGSINLG